MWGYILISVILIFLLKKYFNGPFSKFRREMKGKVVIITGSSAGLGKEAAFQLLEDGAEVVFACRDKGKTMQVINTHKFKDSEASKRAKFFKLDLTSFKDVFRFSEYIISNYAKIDILMNNAGLFPTNFYLTEDKVESIFQTNHLSHMLLTFLLLDHFDKKEGRIINVSSYAHYFSDFSLKKVEDLESNQSFEYYKKIYYNNVLSRNVLYADTKLANIYFTQYLAELLEKQYPHIKTAALHPGTVLTEFTRFINEGRVTRYIYMLILPFAYLIMKSPIAGAQTQLNLCYIDFSSFVNGGYYQDCKIGKINKTASNCEIRDSFMNYSWKVLKRHVDPEIMKNLKI